MGPLFSVPLELIDHCFEDVAASATCPISRVSKGCAFLTVKATVKPKSITTNPFNHADLGGLLMTEWE
jgi:hypothetical protein